MKKQFFCALILGCLLFSGCSNTGLNVDGLLFAPKLNEEQTIIHETLIENVGSNIKLKYPRTGENRSAFVIANIDDEPTNEAMVFYEKINSRNESTIRINIMDQIKGKWTSVYDLSGMGTEIDRIIISKLGSQTKTNIIVGYNMINQDEKALQIYNYDDGTLKNIYTDSYSILDIIDIDNDKNNDLITITNSSASGIATASMYKSINGAIVKSSTVNMDTNTISYASFVKGYINDTTPALFVDATKVNGTIQTEVLIFRYNTLQNPMFAHYDELLLNTTRPTGYFSVDLDYDGIVEIPVTSAFTGYETVAPGEKMLLTDWYVYENFYILKKKYSGYYNINDGYVFMIPSRWNGLVTVKADTTTDEIVFYKYDGQVNDDMTELLRIAVTTRGKTNDFLYDGYSLIETKGQLDFLVKLPAYSKETLILTMSEVDNNFYVLE